jgi:hypothetical protein
LATFFGSFLRDETPALRAGIDSNTGMMHDWCGVENTWCVITSKKILSKVTSSHSLLFRRLVLHALCHAFGQHPIRMRLMVNIGAVPDKKNFVIIPAG